MKKVDALLLSLITSLVVIFWYFKYTENIFKISSKNKYLQWKTKMNPVTVKMEHIPVEIEPIPRISKIIFIDTTCVLNDTINSAPGLSLTKRQACAVESAAKMNPDFSVHVLYTCPINGKLEDISNHVRALFLYPNIKLWKLNITRHLAYTPFANWDFMKAISSSQWPIEHASHVLRFVTLWKYGGTYLDLDVIVLKSLKELGTNYVAEESEEDLGIAAMNFAYELMGHEVVQNCIYDILNDFRGDIWTHNGVRALSTALFKLCNVSRVSEMSAEKCKGFRVLRKEEFYAIPYPTWNHFFNVNESENVMNTIKDSYGVHMWNRLSKNTNVTVGSKQPYNLIAETSCPSVHSMSGEYF